MIIYGGKVSVFIVPLFVREGIWLRDQILQEDDDDENVAEDKYVGSPCRCRVKYIKHQTMHD